MKKAFLAALLFATTGCTVTTSTSTSTGGLSLETPVYSATKDKSGERSDHKFKAGEEVYVIVPVSGFKKDDKGQLHLQGDLSVKDSKGTSVLDKPNIVDATGKTDGDTVPVTLTITMPATAPTDEYKVAFTLRDVNAGASSTQNSSFNFEGGAAPAADATPAADASPAEVSTEAPAEPASTETP